MKRDRIIYKVSQYLTLKEIGRAFFLSPTAVSNIINKRRNKNMQEIFKVVSRKDKYIDFLDKVLDQKILKMTKDKNGTEKTEGLYVAWAIWQVKEEIGVLGKE